MTMTLISTTQVAAGGAASITFSAIPATYTDLVVLLSSRATSTTAGITLNLNGSASSFTTRYMQGNGSAGSSTTNTTLIGNSCISTDTSNAFSNLMLHIPDYAGSANKTFTSETVTENNSSTAYQQVFAGIWANTSAITSITLNLANFAQNTTASLYGVLKGSGGATVS